VNSSYILANFNTLSRAKHSQSEREGKDEALTSSPAKFLQSQRDESLFYPSLHSGGKEEIYLFAMSRLCA